MFSVKVKGTMSSATRREALTHINTMEEEMKIATERLKEMTQEKEAERMKVDLYRITDPDLEIFAYPD